MAGNGKINNMLIPSVSKLPKHDKVDVSNKLQSGEVSDFKKLLQDKIGSVKNDHGINLSLHAAKRLSERNLSLNNDDFFKIKDAIGKLKEKGGQDSLIITDKAAYIVDVNNNKIVTAIDRGSLSENVFTKIDSTVVV
jgi:flagellar operon protein